MSASKLNTQTTSAQNIERSNSNTIRERDIIMTTTMQEIERLFTESEENERAEFELIMQDYETACETACEYEN